MSATAARPSPSPPKPWERAGAATASTPLVLPTSSASPAVATPAPTVSSSIEAPALPERPATMTSGTVGAYGQQANSYASRYGTTTSPYASTMSPYGSSYSRLGTGYGGYGGLSSYGSYGGGYGSFGGYGMGGMGGYGMGGYGMGGYGMGMPGSVGPDGLTLSQRMESGTAATFQVIQSIVGAFGGFAQMLEATFMATHSSFFALISLTEQFGQLRNYLGQLLSVFALVRWCRNLISRITGRGTPVDGLDVDGFKAFSETGGKPPAAQQKLSKKPLIVFFLTVIGLPWLMTRLVRLITQRQEEEARRIAAQGGIPQPALDAFGRPIPGAPAVALDPSSLTFVRATHEYAAQDPAELSLKPDDIVAVLTPLEERQQPGWWNGRLRDGTTGWFPSTHVAELPMVSGKAAKKVDPPTPVEAGKPVPKTV